MRKIFLLLALSLNFIFASAQKIITIPYYGASNVKDLTIDKIVLNDTATLLYFQSQYAKSTWFRISSGSYLNVGKEKLAAKAISGIAFNKQVFGKTSFVISFPPISTKTKSIDYFEGDCENCFKILDIDLISSTKKSLLPAGFYKNWFKTNGSQQWVLTLNRKKALYNSRVWDYNNVKQIKQTFKLGLKYGKQEKYLYLKTDKAGRLIVWENNKEKQTLTDTSVDKKFIIANDQPFTQHLFKRDSTTYAGYVNGYSPKLGYQTGRFIINNIINSKQETYLLKLAADGSFSVKVPMNNPQECMIEIGDYFETVFLAPGKKLFQYINFTNNGPFKLYMGDYANVNRELDAVSFTKDIPYDKTLKDILYFNPQQFKSYITDIKVKNLAALDKYRNEHTLSLKSYQIAAMRTKYHAATVLLEYNTYKESAYRKANHINDTVRELPIVPAKLDSSYYSFMNTLPLNDEVSALYCEYDSFINRLKFSDIINEYADTRQIKFYIEGLQALPPTNNAEREILKELNAALIASKSNALYNIYKKDTASFNKLFEARKEYLSKYNGNRSTTRAEALKTITNADMQLMLDIMTVQDEAGLMAQELTPLTELQLTEAKNKLNTNLLFGALTGVNNDIKRKIEENMLKRNFVVNQVPKTAADSVFFAMMKKYKGKVIFVDFWATWCGPCRAGIEEIASLKEELKNEKIAFVYITDPSSPEETYKKMIPGISGEHFKLNKDEWNYVAGKFSISTIPRYMLINKKGELVNENFENPGNNELKIKLLTMAKE